MGTAKHKNQHATFTANTNLGPERVAELAKEAAATVKNSIPGQPFVRFDSGGPAGLDFSVCNIGGRNTLMAFSVALTDTGSGTSVRTKIGAFKTTQSTFMFIPIGPKSLLGYSQYKRFVAAFDRALRAADAAASGQLVERPA